MLVLLPLLWLLSAWARDTTPPKDTKYIIRTISSCPDVGYFFKRESSPNSVGARCLLCFCQSDGTAICWQRENKRCDVRHYQHRIGKRDTRVRRSPFPGFSDIFFRDAARDIFNKQLPQSCKPYETSFSEGCPPDDWCTGCTVCDCDANGRWDCHILSFCPDKKNGTKTKKTKVPLKGQLKRTTVKPNKTTSKGKKNTARTAPRPTRRTTKKPPVKNYPKQLNNARKTNGTRDRSIQKRNNGSPKPLIKKVDSPPKKQVVQIINNTQVLLNANETAKITQEVYKKVASAVQKMITNKISASVQAMKNLQKRSVGKKTQPCVKKSKNAKKFMSTKPNKNKFKKYSGKSKKKAKFNIYKYNYNITQKKKFGTTTKKPVKPNGTGEHKKVKRHSQSHRLKPTYTPDRSWRMKREIVLTENTTSTYVNTETTVPDMTTTDKNIIDTFPVTYNYYKYSVVTPEPYTNINETNKDKDEVNNTNTFKDISSSINNIKTEFRVTNNVENNTEIPNIKQNITNIEFIDSHKKFDRNISMDKIPEYNDLKFKDWSHFKLLKYNYIVNRLLSLNNTYDIVNGSRNAYYNQFVTARTHTRDIQRLVTPAVRRYNKSMIVNTNSCNTKSTNVLNQASTFKDRIYHKIEGLQTVLNRLLSELRKDNAVKVKPRRFNIIKYLKRFFRKIFKQRNGKGAVALNNKASFNRHIIETICDNFGNCDLTKVNRVVLNKKTKELYAESFNVLKSINIIKGLLHLLDMPRDTTLVDTQNSKMGDQKSNFKGDIHKLNAILKNSYLTSDHKFTETELTQMKYVKKNTQSFIQSVGRFATKLNEIIFILTKKYPDNKRNLVIREAKRNKVNDIKKNKKSVKKYVDKKKTENNKKNNETKNNDDTIRKNELAKEYINKLKYMLEKYSIIQGALVDSMQQSLHKFGSISDEKSREDMIDRNKNASSKIVRISSSIINNLKKLKNLAAAFNSKHRTKRDVLRDDDAMDYLLTLMEYLLKQNHPLDAAPVNDGIDLLIEAIKTAPDIKPIKKKVLQSLPVNTNVVHKMTKRTTTTTTMPPVKMSKEDTSLDSNKISKEDNDTSNAKYDTNEQMTNEEKSEDQSEKIIFEDAYTQSVYYNKDTPNAVPPEYTTISPPGGTTEHNNFEKLEKAIEDSATGIDGKKIEVFIGDVEDEDANNEVTSTTAATEINEDTEVTTTTVPIETTEMSLFQVKDRQKINSIDTSGSNVNSQKRVTLDWLDEGEDQETRENKSNQNTTERVQTQAPSTKAVGFTKMHSNDNVSSITKELNDDDGRKKKSNPNIEEIMLKKHMDLLNSLDYGTERSEPDDSDSKDGDERYPGDVFPSYFV